MLGITIWSVMKFILWLIFYVLLTTVVAVTIFGIGYVAFIVLGALLFVFVLFKGLEQVSSFYN